MLEKLKERSFQNALILIIAILIFSLVYLWKNDFSESSNILILGCASTLLLLTLFFNLKWYYLALVFFIPLSLETGVFGGAQISFPSEALLVLALPILLIFNHDYRSGLLEAVKHPLAIILIVDLGFLLIAALFSSDIAVSLKRVIIRVIFFFGFFGLYFLFKEKRKVTLPLLAYIIGLGPVMYFTLIKHARSGFDARRVFDISAPYYSDHTIYGACIAFTLPMLLIVLWKRKLFIKKRWHLYLLSIIFTFLVISEIAALSRAAILSLAVAGIFMLLLRFRVKFSFLIITLVCSLGVLFAFRNEIYDQLSQNEAVSNDGDLVNHFSSTTNLNTDASNMERINRWICAWRMFEEKPLIGYGPGTYQFNYNQFQTISNKTYISTNSGNRGNAHSEYLTYLSETGIIGFVIFIMLVLGTIYFGMQNHYETQELYLRYLNLGALLGIITFFFHGLFNSFIDQSKMAFLVYSAIAIIVWVRIKGNRLSKTS